nr:MAG TPA: hypothetical protein [Bacteriophage sp.]DAP43447.1 MAG TPA: hypothetical protein [Caudoviricetes sp.]
MKLLSKTPLYQLDRARPSDYNMTLNFVHYLLIFY